MTWRSAVDVSIAKLRLMVKRNFTTYYLQLHGYGVTDPTDAIISCTAYLMARGESLGRPLSEAEMDAEIRHMAGEMEQDLLRRGPDMRHRLDDEPLPGRLRECMRVAQSRAWADRGMVDGNGRDSGE